jgi:O-succinylbenzoate synthase
MNIEKVTLRHVRVPLVELFKISSGQVEVKDGILVSVHSSGLVGCGEASPMAGSFYSEDTPESTWDELSTTLIPDLLKHKEGTLDELCDLIAASPCNPFARAGVETALWDLEAQIKQVPLCVLLGSLPRPVESGFAAGIYPTHKELLSAIESHMKEGYKRIKIKIAPGWDIRPLRHVRSAFGDFPLMVDANCAYGREDIPQLERLDDFFLEMIEQPLPKDDLEGHALLASKMMTPICLDESAKDLETVRKAISMNACSIVNIKIQRVGGLREAKRIHDLCDEEGVPVWAGTMPELGIGGVQTLHLATLGNFQFPTDVQASERWFVDDIITPLIKVDKGFIKIPEGVGNCYALNEEAVRRFLIQETEHHP